MSIHEIEDEHSESSDDEEVLPDSTPGAGASTSSAVVLADAAKKNKKKKKKSNKASKALGAIVNKVKGKDDGSALPDQLVEVVKEKLNEGEDGEAKGATDEQVRKALAALKIMDVIEGKSGLGGKNRKDAGDHQFWRTQPVPQIGDDLPEQDGPIEPSRPREEVKQTPDSLPKEFEWSTLDLTAPAQSKEVYELLSANYVEDHDAAFRFEYTADFLRWALMPPGFHPEWHVGVRVKSTKKLVAFISGIPVNISVRDKVVPMSEINFLCVHKKLRSKRLAPVLIKEVTRQCHLKGIFQAVYTAGVVLPTPVSTCRYYHRSINMSKLVDIRFTSVPRNTTLARLIIKHRLPPTTSLRGLREMEEKDIGEVQALWSAYSQRFKMFPEYSEDELRHNLLSGKGRGEPVDGRREGQVTWSYVVENPTSGKISDFFSFYFLPSQVMQSTKHRLLDAAYLFYYATDVAFEHQAEQLGLLKRRLLDLMKDALILADQAKFDVFNALTLMDNHLFLSDLLFGGGDGYLNYYLYNYRTAPLEGFNPLPASQGGGQGVGRGVAVVML